MEHTGNFLNRRGQTTILLVAILGVVGSIFIMTSVDVFRRDYNFKTRDFDQVLLNEATISSFAVMESALARRLWEPPPDNNCLKAESFESSGTFANGLNWKVTAKYNFATKNYELQAQGDYNGLKAVFKKRIKVLDVSDYLLFSGNDQTVTLPRVYGENAPSALIARDRRVYIKGPFTVGGHLDRPNPGLDWSGTPAKWPTEFGTIIQGDRIQFSGGIQYGTYSVPEPNSGNGNLKTLLAPYSNAWGTPDRTYSQQGAGSAVITKDYTKATTLRNQVISGSAGPLTLGSVASEIYPIALFSGNPPLEAWSASDSGGYFNNPNRYSIFYYSYALQNSFGIRADFTCFSKAGANQKSCSNSEHFPKGFSNWRKNAGLEGVLFTADSEEIPSPKLSWDNLEALEEDAKQCGTVISTPTNSYADCAIWDLNFIKKYASQGSGITCDKTSQIDLDSLALSNFNVADLSDPGKKERLLRRVVYLKVPAEIKQNNARGLMMGALSNDIARKNLSLWVVSEDTLALRGFQQDTTSPLSVDPTRMREVGFNHDLTTNNPALAKPFIPLTILSPEQVTLLSPQYQPLTPSRLQQMWPSSGGKIRPVAHNLTDTRYEEDGFKYGFRKFLIDGVSLITSSKISASTPFYMRGLWSGPDSSADQLPSNLCMISLAGNTLQQYGAEPLVMTSQIPPYNGMANSPIPPLGSNFYGSLTDHFPTRYYPQVFWMQSSGSRQESEVSFTGVRIHLDFESTPLSGKRDLSILLHVGTEGRYSDLNSFDLSHKTFAWDISSYYQNRPINTPCIAGNVAFRNPGPLSPTDARAVMPSTNNGRYIFVQSSPDTSYRDVGAIVGVEQPILEAHSN